MTESDQKRLPRNVNILHRAEIAASTINVRIAVAVTRAMGNMWCAYFFAFLAIVGFPGFHATPSQYVQWLSQTFIQLVALSILAVGQNVLSRHQELMAEEAYHTTMKSFADIELVMQHLDTQDGKILEILAKLGEGKNEEGKGTQDAATPSNN